MNTQLKILSGVVVLVLLAGIVFLLLQKDQTDTEEASSPSTAEVPSINPVSNPVEDLETVNPVEQANPFSGSYRNPFD